MSGPAKRRGAAIVAVVIGGVLTGAGGLLGAQETAVRSDETTPSVAYYFDWINSQYEGSTEAHTLTNLEFWRWLREEYGAQLDVYTLDVGNLDDGPYTAGVGRLTPDHHGTLASEEFRAQFPRGFAPLRDAAAQFGGRLGIWLGPDGFGESAEEERARVECLVALCRDANLRMLKLDTVAGDLRPEKQGVLARTLERCREFCPDLLVLSERVTMGEAAPHFTTYLWEGVETYVDVFIWNETTAPHHRAGALARKLPPGLTRWIEDHGVCLSSCLDFWDDDLVLQTFNRATLLAPEIYGSPWFLRDDELPKLARLMNLARRYGDLLSGARGAPVLLDEERFGPHAVARGDGTTRFLTLRNLTWEPVTYTIPLDETIGLEASTKVFLRRFHPRERIYGAGNWGEDFVVEVPPFRACLLAASTDPLAEVGVWGVDFEVVRDVRGEPVQLRLCGRPGEFHHVDIEGRGRRFSIANSGGKEGIVVLFSGPNSSSPPHRLLAELGPCTVPDDAEALYEATCFAADNNALEVRSLERAGSSAPLPVIAAREAFLAQPMFVNRGIWDDNLFDGDLGTFFFARREGGALRVDFGEVIEIDRLVLRTLDREVLDIAPELHRFTDEALAEYSEDLMTWHPLSIPTGKGTIAHLRFPDDARARYVRIEGAPRKIAEIDARLDGAPLDRARWRASNLFAPYRAHPATAAWTARIKLDEFASGSRLAIAVEGRHGNEGAYAALRVDGVPVGAPDRAVSFPSNTWEYQNVEVEEGYTYLVPLTDEFVGREINVVVLGLEGGGTELAPRVWITPGPDPLATIDLVLNEHE